MSVGSSLEDSLHDVFENAAVLFLGLAQRLLGAKVARHGTLQFDEIAAQFQLHDHLVAQNPQRLDLLPRQLSRLPVHHAERPDGQAAGRGHQRHPCIETDVRTAGDQGVPGKPGVHRRIRHDEQVCLREGVRGKGGIARSLRDVQPDPRLEPVAVRVHQAHQRHRGLADLGSQTGQVVEGFLGWRVEDVVSSQRLESIDFVGEWRGWFHR